MAWTAPSDPVTSTVITVAYAVANLLTQIRWLRLMTGNADPPATSYVVVSDSTSATSWKKVPADALAAGAAVSSLGYTPLNKAGDTMLGPLGVNGALTAGAGASINNAGLAANAGATINGAPLTANAGVTVSGSALVLTNASVETIVKNTGAVDVNLYQRAGLVVNTSDGSRPAITFSRDGTGAAALMYESGSILRLINSSNVDAQILTALDPTATPAAGAIPRANASGKLDAWVTSGTGDAVSVAGHVPTATPAPGALPLANASGKLDDWVTPSVAGATVPTGLIAMFEDTNPANMPSGWSRYTAGDGRIIVGDGTTFSQTFTSTNNYGSAWSHTHTDAGHGHGNVNHNHGASALSVSGHTGSASASTANMNVTTGAGSETYVPDHNHDATANGGTMDVAGATDSTTTLTIANGTASIGTTAWLPPMRSLMYVRKN